MDALLEKERAARAEAESSARLKDDFLAILSHELRTPLSAVLGWSRILKQDLDDPKRALAAVDVIERNAQLQAQLITDLLDVSRIMSGTMRLELEPLDVASVLESAIASMAPPAAAKGVVIDRILAQVRGSVRGDARRLQQAVCNLISNAIKFSRHGGRIRVELRDTGSQAIILVQDEGEGIAAEFLPHLFQRFRQADTTASRRHGGLGLGLSIVKELIELHGGTVSAQSDGQKRGALFTIALPMSAVRSTTAAAPELASATEQERSISRGSKVLVVDDEPDALQLTRRMLEELRADVTTVATADSALELILRGRFDFISSDIGMPGRDGHDFIAAVRAHGISTPAVALTAFVREEDRNRALAAGFQAHVAKPVDIGVLRATLLELARQSNGTSSRAWR
jgi:CheY-like chemotaxis protein